MFELVVMPLIELWVDEEDADADALKEQLALLQKALGEQVGETVEWVEELDEDATYEADGIDALALYALRAAAAWLELHKDLDGFEIGEEPWAHDAFVALEDKDEVERFPQILHSDETDYTAFLPATLADVYVLVEEGADLDDAEMAVGSVKSLRAELDVLRIALGLEEGLEEHLDDVVFDPAIDPLAAARYAWVVLSARTNEAIGKNLPLMLVFEDFDMNLDTEGVPLSQPD